MAKPLLKVGEALSNGATGYLSRKTAKSSAVAPLLIVSGGVALLRPFFADAEGAGRTGELFIV